MINKIIWPALLLLVISLASGLLFNLLSDNGLPIFYKEVELTSGMNLNAEETYRLLREKRALFIDARTEKEYRTAHIPGAINIPGDLPRDQQTARLKQIAKNALIVVYCSSVSCLSARRLAGFMTYLDFQNVAVFLAGFEEWQALRYPEEKE